MGNICTGETKDEDVSMPVDVQSKRSQHRQKGIEAVNDDNVGILEEEKHYEDINKEYISEDGSVYKGDK